MAGPVRVLLVATHPVQYASPLYRLYAADPRVWVTVAYCSLQGAEPGVDHDFGVQVQWDVPLLDGYDWVHPPNRSPRPGLRGFWGLVNPGPWGLIRRERFDVVVCYGYRVASFWIAMLAAKTAGAALVLTTDAHTLDARDGARWKRRVKRWVLPRLFALADGVFTPSSRGARLMAKLGVSGDRLFLTPYVVDNDFFERAAAGVDRARVRARWGIPQDAFVALFVGKVVPWKRPLDLVEALPRVPDDRVWAVFVGEGELRERLVTRARELGVAHRTCFAGFLNQKALPAAYAASDVLVLPSEHEPFGLVVNEAFCCGIPAIVSEACGAVGDLVRDGETGYVIPVGDAGALAARLEELAADAALRARLAMHARARMKAWSPEANVDAFVAACRVLAARGGQRLRRAPSSFGA